MQTAYWILAGVLALSNLGAGALKFTRTKDQLYASGLHWVEDFSQPGIRGIAAAEILGGLGLILPPLTGIAPVLAPIAAVGLAVLQWAPASRTDVAVSSRSCSPPTRPSSSCPWSSRCSGSSSGSEATAPSARESRSTSVRCVDATEDLVVRLRAAMSAAGDPDRARAQQAYLKSAMPHHGIGSPDLAKLLKPFLAEFAPASRGEWERTVLTLWDGATHREERYAAIGFARHKAARRWQDPEALPMYRHLVVTGAWWDLVDTVAGDLVGGVLAAHRPQATPTIRAWATDDHLWLRRTAVLSQLTHRADTDLDLLTYAIEANVDDTSFWLRKAIGWALRQHARTDPDWVRAEVERLGGRLSGLSRREALKHLS